MYWYYGGDLVPEKLHIRKGMSISYAAGKTFHHHSRDNEYTHR